MGFTLQVVLENGLFNVVATTDKRLIIPILKFCLIPAFNAVKLATSRKIFIQLRTLTSINVCDYLIEVYLEY